jgi:flagellar biosynthetic protein FlhB
VAGDKDGKTEKPTARKQKEARKQGQVPRTAELGTWAAMLVGTFLVKMTFNLGMDRLPSLLVRCTEVIVSPQESDAFSLLREGFLDIGIIVSPVALGLMLLGVVLNVAQTNGVVVVTKNLKPKMKRVNPLAGFKRIVGPNAWWEAGKTLAKSIVVGLVVWRAVATELPLLTGSGQLPLSTVSMRVVTTVGSMVRNVSVAGLIMAIADFAWQKRKIGNQLKMSKQDIKDENKRSEGDPKIKSAIRSRQFAMSRNRMMSAIKDADVVLVNPTHIAVALKYDAAKGAPRVIAKGSGVLATKIREEALDKRVPLVQDIPLARAIHRSCEVGMEIPAELYSAVARVLAFVMSLRKRGSANGFLTVPGSAPEVAAVDTAAVRRRKAKRRTPVALPPGVVAHQGSPPF